jgi:ElaB/YqjD/DUF883 family membrane-anchored ribosome-binding protein
MNSNQSVEIGEDLAGKVGDAVESASAFAHHAADELRQDAEKVIQQGEDCTRHHIASGIATAFVGGLLLGLLLRRERPSFQKRYVEEPLSHAQDLALALAAPLAMALRDRYNTARSAATHAADRISDLDFDSELMKGARKWGNKLKFW